MLRRDLGYLDEEHTCPHCKQKMSCCEAPPIHIGDGLGWGSEVLFICLHDNCSLFLNGWDRIEVQYGHHASYRYMELPDSKEGNLMMVGNSDAFKGSIIDPQELKNQNERYHREKQALEDLKTCIEDKNINPVLELILNEAADIEGRKKAIPFLGKFNDLTCIDPIRNHEFRDPSIEMACNHEIFCILKNHYKKECSQCGEIVKMQAKICMHCKMDFKA